MTTPPPPEKRLVSDDEVSRIPWRQFLRDQFYKILGFFMLLVLLFFIIDLSATINGNTDTINPDHIIELQTSNHVYLMILSSILFLAVLAIFTKVVLIDQREAFGITHWTQKRVIGTVFLTTSFLSMVYILLDVALVNIYLMTLPTWLVWSAQFVIAPLEPLIPSSTDRLAYSTIRGDIFLVLLGFVFIFPLLMFLNILTRFGRRTIKERRERKSKLPLLRLLLALLVCLLFTALSYYLFATLGNQVAGSAMLFVFLGLVLADAVLILLMLFKLLNLGLLFGYSNFLLIFPFIFLFYLLPGGLWGLWDLLVILTTGGGLDNTIYTLAAPSTMAINPSTTSIAGLSRLDLVRFYLQTVLFNLRPVAFLRIIELDFILIVGLSALVIGFSEGYSILAIVRSIAKGVSIAKTGRVAQQSAPKMVVITSRLFFLLAWLSFFWDNLVGLFQSISLTFDINLPLIDLPPLLHYVVDLSINLGQYSHYLLVLTVLAVPLYFILTSAFKFLSVSLVLERIRDDKQYYYLLISAAYILIVTNIFASIAALPQFQGAQHQFLPLGGAATNTLLPFVAKIFELMETVAFYCGVVYIFIEVIRNRIRDRKQPSPPEETEQEVTTTDPASVSEKEESHQLEGSQ